MKTTPQKSHTATAYGNLDTAYDFFNKVMWEGKLPSCLITLRRHKGCYGYFHSKHFSQAENHIDEISLNPTRFNRTIEETISTLVHEMAHLWQAHFGKPAKGAYHNREWGTEMKRIGLYPSSTGGEGGKETGNAMSHYILEDGMFAEQVAKFLKATPVALYKEKETSRAARKTKNASKTKYTCSCDTNIWGKPGITVTCDDCGEQFVEEGLV